MLRKCWKNGWNLFKSNVYIGEISSVNNLWKVRQSLCDCIGGAWGQFVCPSPPQSLWGSATRQRKHASCLLKLNLKHSLITLSVFMDLSFMNLKIIYDYLFTCWLGRWTFTYSITWQCSLNLHILTNIATKEMVECCVFIRIMEQMFLVCFLIWHDFSTSCVWNINLSKWTAFLTIQCVSKYSPISALTSRWLNRNRTTQRMNSDSVWTTTNTALGKKIVQAITIESAPT